MPTRPEMLRLLRGSSTAVDLDTEGGRAFLQERLVGPLACAARSKGVAEGRVLGDAAVSLLGRSS